MDEYEIVPNRHAFVSFVRRETEEKVLLKLLILMPPAKIIIIIIIIIITIIFDNCLPLGFHRQFFFAYASLTSSAN